jgi:hypothetical protein
MGATLTDVLLIIGIGWFSVLLLAIRWKMGQIARRLDAMFAKLDRLDAIEWNTRPKT